MLVKKNNALQEHAFIPTRSTVAVQTEDGGPWAYDTTLNHSDDEHNAHTYKICITKMG